MPPWDSWQSFLRVIWAVRSPIRRESRGTTISGGFQFVPENAPGSALLSALQDATGLKLNTGKGPV